MQIRFEHDYQQKIMSQRFEFATELLGEDDVMRWRQLWMDALKSWHSPYKSVIDASELSLAEHADREAIKGAFARMEKVLSGFFLKRAVVYGAAPDLASVLPFESFPTDDAAWEAIGLRKKTETGVPLDFRGAIQLQNHFRQHVVELSFATDVTLDSKEKLATLKSKLTNNLMQWHSAWSLLIDCSHLVIAPELFPDFEQMLRFFRGFFLKEVLGYQPKSKECPYPFQVYRARHNAAGRLEVEGLFSGEDANCRTRKPT
ncbi:MAG: hypothetical protein ACOVS5_15420 [Oligoflexus sp.]